MKKIAIFLFFVLLTAALTACGGSVTYKDGTYTGQSAMYEGEDDGSGAGYGVVKLTIKDNKITACEYDTYELDGTLKDENYGKKDGEVANQDFYNRAQRAVRAVPMYAEKLLETGDLSKVDGISGATISYNEFKEAVTDALNQAKK
ncbi:MAG: FMN-binding protein [Flexilinea sp.]|nr:FMN-binding protein [Flexilinea sp.]